MIVQILKLEHGVLVDANILTGDYYSLPNINDGWYFNFNKHAKQNGVLCFVLVAAETPNIIEGCLIYKMREGIEPYMAYLEIAPHNKSIDKKYDRVAGCLIAFASRLSFKMGKGDYLGWLAFEVLEKTIDDANKLMLVYSKKYRAKRFSNTTTMYISPEDGEWLIREYLSYQKK